MMSITQPCVKVATSNAVLLWPHVATACHHIVQHLCPYDEEALHCSTVTHNIARVKRPDDHHHHHQTTRAKNLFCLPNFLPDEAEEKAEATKANANSGFRESTTSSSSSPPTSSSS